MTLTTISTGVGAGKLITSRVMVAAPVCPDAGTTVKVREVPPPPSVTFPSGMRAGFDEERRRRVADGSDTVNGTGPSVEFSSIHWSGMVEIVTARSVLTLRAAHIKRVRRR